MNTKTDVERQWWRFGPFTWIGIAILLIVNIVVFTGLLTPTRQDISWAVYLLNPLVWPAPVAWLLWALAGLKAIHWWYGPDFLRKSLVFLILAIVVVIIVFLVREIMRPGPIGAQKGRLMQWYYWAVLSPWTEWIDRGAWSWKVLIAPGCGLLVISFLISFAVRQRKERKKNERDKNNI